MLRLILLLWLVPALAQADAPNTRNRDSAIGINLRKNLRYVKQRRVDHGDVVVDVSHLLDDVDPLQVSSDELFADEDHAGEGQTGHEEQEEQFPARGDHGFLAHVVVIAGTVGTGNVLTGRGKDGLDLQISVGGWREWDVLGGGRLILKKKSFH